MARPERNNVDYFPFYCEDGNKMFYIEETYGNDGFATFIKLLRELAKTNYHFLDLSKPTTIMFLSAKCKISKETLKAIINDLVDLGKFDKMLWEENQVIWCQDFIDSIQDAYFRRNNKCITYQGLLQHLISLGIRKPIKCTKKSDSNPQTKLEDIKENEIKVKETKFNIKESLCSLGVSNEIINDYLAVRKLKKLANTETAFKKLVEEINKTELEPNEVIKICVEKSWGGFNHKWLIEEKEKSFAKKEIPQTLEEKYNKFF